MKRSDRWQHLVQSAFAVSEAVAAGTTTGPREGKEEALRLLDSVLEVFPSTIDPIEDFEGYSVRRLALALRDSLVLTPAG